MSLALAVALLLAPTPSSGSATLMIDGAVSKPTTISVEQIAAMPHVAVKRADHGATIQCEGVPLVEILRMAGLPSGKQLYGPSLNTVLLLTAADKYQATLSLAELDSLLGNTQAFVVDRCDGKPLAADKGPIRLILPADQRGARSIHQLQKITVRQVQ